MRKVVLQMMTTMNGRLDDPFAWIGGVSDDLYREIDRVYETFDTILVGRTTYDEMVSYWPEAGNEAGASATTKSMARKMNTYKKFVLSSGKTKASLAWNNSEQVPVRSDEDLMQFIRDLKAQTGGDIHLSGGARLAQTFIRLGLVDEYNFFVHPVVSAGMTWFDPIAEKCDMDLVSATTHEHGVVGLVYKTTNRK